MTQLSPEGTQRKVADHSTVQHSEVRGNVRAAPEPGEERHGRSSAYVSQRQSLQRFDGAWTARRIRRSCARRPRPRRRTAAPAVEGRSYRLPRRCPARTHAATPAPSADCLRQHEGRARRVRAKRPRIRHLRNGPRRWAPGVASDWSAALLCREWRSERLLGSCKRQPRRPAESDRPRARTRVIAMPRTDPSSRGRTDDCIARMMRKSNHVRSPPDAALLLL